VHLLCRSAHPRAMTTGNLLPAHRASLPEQGRETIEVPAHAVTAHAVTAHAVTAHAETTLAQAHQIIA